MVDKLAYSAAEVAALLGVSRPTVYALARRDNFPSFHVGDRRLLISAEGLRRWVAEQAGEAVS